jgi:phosphoribosyl-AMP cyclohydrolase
MSATPPDRPAGDPPAAADAAADAAAAAAGASGDWLDAVRWDAAGLVAAIAQEASSQRILMVAWMNREALAETVRSGRAVYWSRSRQRLWRKGEQSGHGQAVREVRLDCDGDAVLLTVEQDGGIACHTGRHSCFFSRLENGRWVAVDPVLRDPESIYR